MAAARRKGAGGWLSLPRRLKNRIKFEVERFILYRALHQLLLIAVVIALIALIGGIAVYFLTDDFGRLPEAIWWAFLRLTDPGYIGDDAGGIRRTISTIVSVLGYVLFLGALVAVMTQGLNQAIRRLQYGLTPIAQNDHILILGWSNRTPIIVQQFLLSESRVASFLKRRGVSDLKIVILAEEVTPEMIGDIRALLGSYWKARKITLRSGTPLRLDHLERVDFRHASVIILPSGEFGEDALEYPDGRTIKTLLSMRSAVSEHEPGELPMMVAEIRDYRKGEIAHAAYGGPIEVLESDLFLARLLSQIIRVPGLSHIYYELLTHEIGNEIYLRSWPQVLGVPACNLPEMFPGALILGLYRDDRRRFHPLTAVGEEPVREGDRLVLIAPGAETDELIDETRIPSPPPAEIGVADPPERRNSEKIPHRLLILGWNRTIPALLSILEDYGDETYDITSLSLITPEERLTRLNRRGVELRETKATWITGEYTSMPELEALEPWRFSTVLICASEWLESSGESDARTVLGYLILESILEGKQRPHIVAQLMNETNAVLFPEDRCETLTGPVVLSHLLAQIGLQQSLRGLFEELFGPGGAEIYFRPVVDYLPLGESTTFEELRRACFRRGEILLGLRRRRYASVNGGIELNPDRSVPILCERGDDVVVLVDQV